MERGGGGGVGLRVVGYVHVCDLKQYVWQFWSENCYVCSSEWSKIEFRRE